MSLVAETMLDALGTPALYRETPESESVEIMAIYVDASSAVRAGRSTLMAYEAEATISADLAPVRFGRIEVGESAYEIAQIQRANTPGLVALGLTRVSGDGESPGDDMFADAVLGAIGKTIQINGQDVIAQVTRAGDMVEEDGWGNPVEVVRTIISVSENDAVEIKAGDPAIIDGDELRVQRVLRDGHGLSKVVLE